MFRFSPIIISKINCTCKKINSYSVGKSFENAWESVGFNLINLKRLPSDIF